MLSLCEANGAESTRETMLGLTIPRPVRVKSIHHMGKEEAFVIVEPCHTRQVSQRLIAFWGASGRSQA